MKQHYAPCWLYNPSPLLCHTQDEVEEALKNGYRSGKHYRGHPDYEQFPLTAAASPDPIASINIEAVSGESGLKPADPSIIQDIDGPGAEAIAERVSATIPPSLLSPDENSAPETVLAD